MRNSVKIKKYFAALLALSVTMGLFPGTALAADDKDAMTANSETALTEVSEREAAVSGLWTDYAAEAFHDGAYDEEAHTLTIDNAEELALFAESVNEGLSLFGYEEGSEIMYSGMTVLLSQDIDLSAHYWTPIGSGTRSLGADFDGGGRTITGLTIETDRDSCGLIGCMKPGEDSLISPRIVNLTIDGAWVKGEKYAGILLGSGNADISNVAVQNSSVEGASFAGGIAGTVSGQIRYCSVENTSLTAAEDEGMPGGIVGLLDHGEVNGCTVTGGAITGTAGLGGMAGYIITGDDKQEPVPNTAEDAVHAEGSVQPEKPTESAQPEEPMESVQLGELTESAPSAPVGDAPAEPAPDVPEDAEPSEETAESLADGEEEPADAEPVDETACLSGSGSILPEEGATSTDAPEDCMTYSLSDNTVTGVLFSPFPAAELGTEPECIGFLAGDWDEMDNPSAQTLLTLENNNYMDNLSPEDIAALDYVASVGKEQYISLADAVKAADAQTVSLLSDAALSQCIEIEDGRNITLNLNGFAINPSEDTENAETEGKLPDALFVVHNGGALCIEDASESGMGIISCKTADGKEMPEGSTLIRVGTRDDRSPGAAVLIVSSGTLAGKDSAVSCEGSTADVTIHSGALSGACAALSFQSGSLSITGGSFAADALCGAADGAEAPLCAAVCVTPGNEPATVSITGGSFYGSFAFYEDSCAEQPILSLSISDGIFTGAVGDAVYVRDAAGFITGGKFSSDPSAYLAEGYGATKQK